MNDINLFDFIEVMANGQNSLYRGNRFDRTRFIEYMDVNGWFGVTPVMKDKAPMIPCQAAENIRTSLTLWLSAYMQPDKRKLQILLTYFENSFPKTCGIYRKYTADNNLNDEPAAWQLLDCIFSNIKKEICDCSEQEIETLVNIFDSECSLNAAKLFAGFLKYTKLTKWDYNFYSRGKFENNNAFPLKDFAVMAYYVFNEEIWEKRNLIAKAVRSRQFADIWFLTALHFICALRKTDMLRIPAPTLPYEAGRILVEIENRTFPENEALALADELKIRMNLKQMKPGKTSAYANITDLKLFIPESLRKPMGIIAAVAAAHHPEISPGEPFVFASDNNMPVFRKFFGDEFVNAAGGGRHFSVRRCNKSYLQGIDSVYRSEDAPGKPKGYILAALARNHKGGIGKLPDIADIYLKDANFTGYSPEFIAREMFERGVLSFIPAVLLEIYANNEFKQLSIQNQTLLIREVGLTPHNIENLLGVAESALQKARKTVNTIIREQEMRREYVGAVLQNIVSGSASSRMSECLCLMTAVGRSCPFPERAGCIGCGYEIYTKSAVHLLMREFIRLKKQRGSADTGEAWRYSAIMEQAIIPAVAEIVTCVKMFAPNTDADALLDIVERGIKDNECVPGKNIGKLQPINAGI